MNVQPFFCAGGQCQTKQCLYCVTLVRVEQEIKRCFSCAMLKELCSCKANLTGTVFGPSQGYRVRI